MKLKNIQRFIKQITLIIWFKVQKINHTSIIITKFQKETNTFFWDRKENVI